MIKLSVGEFQWKTTEQVYPFEKASDGSTLYCKEVNCGRCPNNGYVQIAHNVPFTSMYQVHRYEYVVRANTIAFAAKDLSGLSLNNALWTYVDLTTILVQTYASWIYNTNLYLLGRIVYKK